jgi:tRNA(Arg) A34 adenosine deaminase TadA
VTLSVLSITLPEWAAEFDAAGRVYATDLERMQLAVDLSRVNVERGSGGPFGAAIFDAASGALLGIGMNSVVRLNNSTLHAEMMAFMRAQAAVGSFSLATASGAGRELFTSCEPCAMCLGGVLWSGVTRVVFAARRDDAQRLAFDEGPVFPESFAYLRRRGIRIEGGPLRDEARQVMEAYRARGGMIYNA